MLYFSFPIKVFQFYWKRKRKRERERERERKRERKRERERERERKREREKRNYYHSLLLQFIMYHAELLDFDIDMATKMINYLIQIGMQICNT